MPRNGSGVYSVPAGTTATPNTPIESAKYNAFVADLTNDLNLARPIVAGGTGATTKSGAQQALDLEPGVDIQAYNATLAALAALTLAADKMIYATGANTLATADLTAFARTLLAGVDAAAVRTLLALGDMATKDDVAIADIDAAGTADGTTALFGDGVWRAIPSWELIDTITPGAVSNVELDLTGLTEARIWIQNCSPTTTAAFRLELRGATSGWSAAVNLIASATAAQVAVGAFDLNPAFVSSHHSILGSFTSGSASSPPLTYPLTPYSIGFEWAVDQAIDRARLSWSTGNFDAGRIMLWGR